MEASPTRPLAIFRFSSCSLDLTLHFPSHITDLQEPEYSLYQRLPTINTPSKRPVYSTLHLTLPKHAQHICYPPSPSPSPSATQPPPPNSSYSPSHPTTPSSSHQTRRPTTFANQPLLPAGSTAACHVTRARSRRWGSRARRRL